MSLYCAADVLDDLAAGRMPRQTMLQIAAMALETEACLASNQDLLDAAKTLRTLATGGTLDLDEQGRSRAALLAATVRKLAV